MFSSLIEKLQRREDLTVDEASAAMGEIMDGRASSAQIAGLLIALAMKGERPSEVVGLARTMRLRAVPLSTTFDPVFDTCGTGGDGIHTFNVLTVSALVVAASGITSTNQSAAPAATARTPRGTPHKPQHPSTIHRMSQKSRHTHTQPTQYTIPGHHRNHTTTSYTTSPTN